MAKIFDDQNFQSDVIEMSNTKPVLVDFYAAWCGPCKMQGPIVEKLADEIGDKAVVGKMDTEAAQATAMKYGIMSIPTLMIFRNGQPVETFVGLQHGDGLKAALEKHR